MLQRKKLNRLHFLRVNLEKCLANKETGSCQQEHTDILLREFSTFRDVCESFIGIIKKLDNSPLLEIHDGNVKKISSFLTDCDCLCDTIEDLFAKFKIPIEVYSMTPDQIIFFKLLSKAPHLEPFWDKEKLELNETLLQEKLSRMEQKDVQVTRFFLTIWNHRDEQFDLFHAANLLGKKEKDIISEWLYAPCWP